MLGENQIHSQLVWLEYFILFFYTFRNISLIVYYCVRYVSVVYAMLVFFVFPHVVCLFVCLPVVCVCAYCKKNDKVSCL